MTLIRLFHSILQPRVASPLPVLAGVLAALFAQTSVLPAQGGASSGVPRVIQYQGRVLDGDGKPWSGDADGKGWFAFALIENNSQLWKSWEGVGESSPDGNGVALPVTAGVFSARLGEPPMQAIPESAFINYQDGQPRSLKPGVLLRVWFSASQDGSFTSLSDIPLASAPYAMAAGVAQIVKDGAVTSGMLGDWTLAEDLPEGDLLVSVQPTSSGLQSRGYVRDSTALNIGRPPLFAYRKKPAGTLALGIAKEQTALATGSVIDVGEISAPSVEVRFTLQNLGNTALSELEVTIDDGPYASEFQATLSASSMDLAATAGLVVICAKGRVYETEQRAVLRLKAGGMTKDFRLELIKTVGIPDGFALIPSGVFSMGRTSGDADAAAPVAATITVNTLVSGQREVSKAEWDEVRTWAQANGYNDLADGAGKASNHPVQMVTWHDAVKWCNARSEMDGLTPVYYADDAHTVVYRNGVVDVTNTQVLWAANGYRLPTEAEWEKSARGGANGKRFPWGGDVISHSAANYNGLSGTVYGNLSNGYHVAYNDGTPPYTSPVGAFAANGYGLYDMAGNVWEWCWDRYSTAAYVNGAVDPKGPVSGSNRLVRGGSFGDGAVGCRAAHRNGSVLPTYAANNVGFRVVRGKP